MSEIEKLRELLTEAREVLFPYSVPNDMASQNVGDLIDRIEEALAESDVRWDAPEFTGSKKHTAMVNGYYIVVEPSTTGVSWAAYPQHQSHKGEFLSKKTLEEAKEAALTAVGWRKP